MGILNYAPLFFQALMEDALRFPHYLARNGRLIIDALEQHAASG